MQPSRPASLDRHLVRGIAWTGAATTITQLLSWAATLLVARLLTAEDYGVVGMANVFLALVQLINEFGIGTAIMSRREMDRDQVARVGGFAVLIGLACAAVTAAASPVVAGFFEEPRVRGVMMVMSLTFVVSGLKTMPYALLARELRFARMAAVDTVEALALVLVTLGAALAGFAYWALVFGVLASRTAGMAMSMAASPHPLGWPLPLARIAGALRFGRDVVFSRVAWYVYSHIDVAVIGRFLGTAALGAYSLGFSVASVPVGKIYALYQKATGPVFAASRDDPAALRRYLSALLEGIALITVPLSVGLAVVARPFVHVVLGDNWEAAVAPLRLLALASALRSLDPVVAQLLVSTGHAAKLARVSAVAAVVMTPLFALGTIWGAAGVAAVWLLAHPVVVLWHQLHYVKQVTGAGVAGAAQAVWPAVSSALVMAAAVVGLDALLADRSMLVRLASGVATGALVYAGALLGLHGARVRAAVAMLRGLRR